MADNINIKNKSARFEYEWIETFSAGLQLTGTEIKSIRAGKVNLSDAFCYFRKDELFVKNLHIAEYDKGTIYNHEPLRQRKLLLTKKELHKLQTKTKEKGFTIIPTKLFISDSGWAKINIALARGKKLHDKRDSIKNRENKRELDRAMKER
jgi:SsrA-binding protein